MAEILKVKFDSIAECAFIGGSEARKISEICESYAIKPDYIINGAHFDNLKKSPTYGVTISDTIVDGKMINTSYDEKASSWKYEGKIYTNRGIAFNADGKMKICSTKTAYNEGYKSFIGGSPHLLENWVINDANLHTSFANQKTYRIAMGFTNDEIVFYFPKEKMSLSTITKQLKDMGIPNAIALDGGGSVNVQKLKGTKYIHVDELKQSRAVSTYICIWLKKEAPTTTTAQEIPNWNGKKAIGVAEIVWDYVNRRVGPGVNYHNAGQLKKGDRITVFATEGKWVQSYGYWISANSIKWVKKY